VDSALGIEYYIAFDGISLVMVLLTGIASTVGILFSWNIEHRAKEFFCLYLTLIGAFMAFPQLRFVSFVRLLRTRHCSQVLPDRIWGSTNRDTAP